LIIVIVVLFIAFSIGFEKGMIVLAILSVIAWMAGLV